MKQIVQNGQPTGAVVGDFPLKPSSKSDMDEQGDVRPQLNFLIVKLPMPLTPPIGPNSI